MLRLVSGEIPAKVHYQIIKKLGPDHLDHESPVISRTARTPLSRSCKKLFTTVSKSLHTTTMWSYWNKWRCIQKRATLNDKQKRKSKQQRTEVNYNAVQWPLRTIYHQSCSSLVDRPIKHNEPSNLSVFHRKTESKYAANYTMTLHWPMPQLQRQIPSLNDLLGIIRWEAQDSVVQLKHRRYLFIFVLNPWDWVQHQAYHAHKIEYIACDSKGSEDVIGFEYSRHWDEGEDQCKCACYSCTHVHVVCWVVDEWLWGERYDGVDEIDAQACRGSLQRNDDANESVEHMPK